ncbi:hypothetical protein BDY19DRAFT_904571 [Irpex rosettiformis]|uniref:Uncharacterized protein n=1 Tax=Irpex rosettiformis TaxID=378272 RepID=A0ACB8UA10_9APHY|nr:hypothetical protein BDY19DRAFT_904571 [Irpex rosettiformis]
MNQSDQQKNESFVGSTDVPASSSNTRNPDSLAEGSVLPAGDNYPQYDHRMTSNPFLDVQLPAPARMVAHYSLPSSPLHFPDSSHQASYASRHTRTHHTTPWFLPTPSINMIAYDASLDPTSLASDIVSEAVGTSFYPVLNAPYDYAYSAYNLHPTVMPMIVPNSILHRSVPWNHNTMETGIIAYPTTVASQHQPSLELTDHADTISRPRKLEHTPEANLICEICGKTPFSRLYELQRHKRTVHEPPQWTCVLCGKKYTRCDTLSRHQKTLHDGR